VIEAEIIKI
jgi:hypothetical protein